MPRCSGRNPIGVAVQHVELVGKLVQFDVDVVGQAADLDVGERQDQRAAVPGFARQDVARMVHHPGLIHLLAGAQELIGIEKDFAPAAVAVLAKVERQQAGLQGKGEPDGRIDLGAARRGKRLVVNEQADGLMQARPFRGIQPVQNRQAGERGVEIPWRDGVPLEDAGTAPAAKPAHSSSSSRRALAASGCSSSTRSICWKRRLILSLEMRTSLTSLLACSIWEASFFMRSSKRAKSFASLPSSSLMTWAMRRVSESRITARAVLSTAFSVVGEVSHTRFFCACSTRSGW